MRKMIISVLILSVALISVPCVFAEEIKAFRDVPETYWAHEEIMYAAAEGMIVGTVPPDSEGIGVFSPEAAMTRAQFLAMITRYLYEEELAGMTEPKNSPWYANNYEIAVQKGLITQKEFSMVSMNQNMNRQEMAMILVRAKERIKESREKEKEEDAAASTESAVKTPVNAMIPDYNTISSYYRSYVIAAYSEGLLTGVDAAGTFKPRATLTRAQAVTVMYRLIAPDFVAFV